MACLVAYRVAYMHHSQHGYPAEAAPHRECWPGGQGSKPSTAAESELAVLGRSLSGSIQNVQSAAAGLQGVASLNTMLTRADESSQRLAAREAASRSLPGPQGIQELNTSLQINDTLSGRM